jgi:hypothetical protein
MVFVPVDPAIKEKVMAAYLAGHGRNQIDRELRAGNQSISWINQQYYQRV